MAQVPEYIPGLAGIPAARSSICLIDGSIGKLQYRGYPIEVLAERCTYEEVAYLLVLGRLPSAPELEEFRNQMIAERGLKFRIIDLLKTLPESGEPMDALIGPRVPAAQHDPLAREAPDHRRRLGPNPARG